MRVRKVCVLKYIIKRIFFRRALWGFVDILYIRVPESSSYFRSARQKLMRY